MVVLICVAGVVVAMLWLVGCCWSMVVLVVALTVVELAVVGELVDALVLLVVVDMLAVLGKLLVLVAWLLAVASWESCNVDPWVLVESWYVVDAVAQTAVASSSV